MKKIISIFIVAIMVLAIPLQVFATQSRSGNFSSNYSLTGNGATDMVAIAKAQVGKTKTDLGYTEAWCADFVCDCAKLAGQSNAIPAYGACEGLHDRIIKAGGREVSISEAKPGDLWFGDWNHSKHYAHVELIYSVGTKISSYGGNGGSPSQVKNHTSVSKSSFANGGEIYVVVRPNYAGGTSHTGTYYFNFNPNGGTMEADNAFNIKYGQDFQIVNLTCVKSGYSFAGWNVKRNNDNTWYVAGVGWCSDSEISSNGYNRKNYTNYQTCKLDDSWIKGLSGDGSYTFYATWNENQEQYVSNFYSNIESLKGKKGGISLSGWAFDGNDINQQMELHVYIGGPAGSGSNCYGISANIDREDVNEAFNGVGSYHGFDEIINTNERGTNEIYIYVVNPNKNTHKLIYSGEINILYYDCLLDVNAVIDNEFESSDLKCEFDIYLNGSYYGRNNDFCLLLPYGTTYEIKNIVPYDNYKYNGLHSDSWNLSGTLCCDAEILFDITTAKTGIVGDPSGDGVIDANDLIYFRKALFSNTETFDERLDVTGDGKFNLADLVRIKKYLADNNIVFGKNN